MTYQATDSDYNFKCFLGHSVFKVAFYGVSCHTTFCYWEGLCDKSKWQYMQVASMAFNSRAINEMKTRAIALKKRHLLAQFWHVLKPGTRTGYKEVSFSSLPFGQAEAKMY